MSGSALSVPFAAQSPRVSSVLWTSYGGEEMGSALADVLLGVVSPSGRLPFTIPTSLAQLPPYLDMSMDRKPGRTHRYLTEEPLYAFSFGLSFGRERFAYSSLSVTPTSISATSTTAVTIRAKVACRLDSIPGDDVLQLYTALRANSTGLQSIPRRQLSAFGRVRASNCSEGAVSLSISPAQLALVDVDGAFRPIAGTYDVWLGSTGPPPFGTFTNDVTAPLHSTLSLTGASQLANENKVGVLAAQA